jgi:uncharacterized protein YcbK (DUF882 family)
MCGDESRVTKHFGWHEFASRGEDVPPQYRANVVTLCDELEVLRAILGRRPITVICGWRSKTHNDAVDGAKRSQHLVAKAADIRVKGLTPTQVYDAILRMIEAGQLHDGGVGVYDTFVHYDTGRGGRRWDKRTS